jgi:hypothetical protein
MTINEIKGSVISNKIDFKETELRGRKKGPHYGSVRVLLNQLRINESQGVWTTAQYMGNGIQIGEDIIPAGPTVPVIEVAYKLNCEHYAPEDSDGNYEEARNLAEGAKILIVTETGKFFTHRRHKFSVREGRYSLYLKLWGNSDVIFAADDSRDESKSTLDAVSVYQELLRK